MREIDIVTAINNLRKNRLKFQIDTDSEASEHSKRLVDRLWPLAAAQIKPGLLHLHLPKWTRTPRIKRLSNATGEMPPLLQSSVSSTGASFVMTAPSPMIGIGLSMSWMPS